MGLCSSQPAEHDDPQYMVASILSKVSRNNVPKSNKQKPVKEQRSGGGGEKKARPKTRSRIRESEVHVQSETRLNQYRWVKKSPLGTGFQSKVYLVEDIHNNNKRYAVKVLKMARMEKVTRKATDSNLMQKNGTDGAADWIEVSVGKIARHKNIVQLCEVIKDRDSQAVYLVLELMSGGVILDKTKRQPYPRERFKSAATDAVRGLAYLHSIGVVHRDVKVENLLVRKDGTLKLSDFGMAHIIPPGSDDQLKLGIGSRKYRSPEMFSGGSYAGFASDVWALGCVFFCMATGHLPFANGVESKDKKAQIHSICNDEVPTADALERDPALKELICRMLDKDPRKRITLTETMQHRWFKQPP